MRREIDIDEIVTYMHCPVMYLFKYKTGHTTQYINLNEKFDIDMHKLFYNMFGRLQDGDEVEVAHLKKAWGALWMSERKGFEVVIAEPRTWRDTYNMKQKAGIKAIDLLWKNYLKVDPFDVILVDQKYIVEIDSDLYLTGKWEVVREVKVGDDKKIEIIDLRVDDTWKNGFYVKTDLKLTADSYAFKQMTGFTEDVIVLYRGLKGAETVTTRTEADHNLLKHTVRQITKAIDQELFYPKITPACSTCPFRHACENYLSAEVLQQPIMMKGGAGDEA